MKSTGTSLIEVLIACFIFSISFLALFSFQATTFKTHTKLSFKATAFIALDNVSEALKIQDEALAKSILKSAGKLLPSFKSKIEKSNREFHIELSWLSKDIHEKLTRTVIFVGVANAK